MGRPHGIPVLHTMPRKRWAPSPSPFARSCDEIKASEYLYKAPDDVRVAVRDLLEQLWPHQGALTDEQVERRMRESLCLVASCGKVYTENGTPKTMCGMCVSDALQLVDERTRC